MQQHLSHISGRPKSRLLKRRSSGFSLVELLVVIVIIGLLASLVTAVAFRAINSAKQTRIQVEVSQLDSALKAYKQKYGSFPPSNFANKPQVEQHLRRAFPQNAEINTGWNSSYAATLGQLTPAQALVFWLGGFSDDPEYPLSGPGGPITRDGAGAIIASTQTYDRNAPTFSFDKSRMVVTSPDPANLQIPVYLPQGGEGVPYAYFRPSNKQYFNGTAHQVFDSSQHGLSAGFARPYATRLPNNTLGWANEDSFQIISAGLDGVFGVGGVYPTGEGYPSAVGGYTAPGYLTSDTGDFDNLTNFSEKPLGDAIP